VPQGHLYGVWWAAEEVRPWARARARARPRPRPLLLTELLASGQRCSEKAPPRSSSSVRCSRAVSTPCRWQEEQREVRDDIHSSWRERTSESSLREEIS